MVAADSARPGVAALVDAGRTAATLAFGLSVLGTMWVWHRLTSSLVESSAQPSGDGRMDGGAESGETDGGPVILEHELDWYRYVKAFDAHHGPAGSPERTPESGSFLRGLRTWLGTRCLRGYTLGDDVYVLENAPRVLRVHQAGHAPSFGAAFDELARDRRVDGGLPDAPLWTADVMLPGDFPHTCLRLRDPRGLTATYEEWVADGRIRRVRPQDALSRGASPS